MKQLLLIATCALLLNACSRHAAPTSNDGSKLTVLSYNIHHANPPSKANVIDLEAIAKVINQEKPDLVALQELDVNTKRSGIELHEANKLGDLTGMHSYFFKTIDYEGGGYGIGILSKYPLIEPNGFYLTTAAGTNGEPRALAGATIELPNKKKIFFACTHLDAQRNDTNRVLQINDLIDSLKKKSIPVIVAGDFNADPSSRVIQTLDSHFTRTCVTGCGFTIPQINPTKTIDFIAYAPAGAFGVAEHKVIDEQYASDHLPVKAVLTVK